MKREEQLTAELKKHDYDDICDHLMFLRGVRWADAHPVNVWHDVGEEPTNYNTQIVYQEKSGICWFASQLDWFEYRWDWKRFVDDHQMVRWAYINDLLPKGGKQ